VISAARTAWRAEITVLRLSFGPYEVDPQLYLTQLLLSLPGWRARELDAWLFDHWKLRHTASLATLNRQD